MANLNPTPSLTNAHPLMSASRDIADSETDLLYFGRSVRPRTLGLFGTLFCTDQGAASCGVSWRGIVPVSSPPSRCEE